MYKQVAITEISIERSFDKTDNVIEISSDKTAMYETNNDYAHKNLSYLSSCIEIADGALNAYLNTISTINNTYFTTDISDIYAKQNQAINTELIEKIEKSDAFATKKDIEAFETRCKAYIQELKSQAISLIMGKLNEAFISQNSVGRIVYGQYTEDGSEQYVFKDNILESEFHYPGQNVDNSTNYDTYDFNFNTGEFSLYKLIEAINSYDYFSSNYISGLNSFRKLNEYDTIEEIEDEISNVVLFNAKSPAYIVTDNVTADVTINAPSASFDSLNCKSIPILKMVEIIIKNQIRAVIKNICDKYIANMTSIPVNP